VFVVVVVVDDGGDGVAVLGVVGSENISSCNNKDDIFLSNYKSTRDEKVFYTNVDANDITSVTDD
jgi:hypothetical protein